jgi:hypothetical protein
VLGLWLMKNFFHERSTPLVTMDEMDAAIAAGLGRLWPEPDVDVVMAALDVSACYQGIRSGHRAKVLEPFADKLLKAIVENSEDRNGVSLSFECFCSASSGLRPLLLERLNDVVLPLTRTAELSRSGINHQRLIMKGLASLAPSALEPYVDDFVALLERTSADVKWILLQSAVLELLQRLPARATQLYATAILRACAKAVGAAARHVER